MLAKLLFVERGEVVEHLAPHLAIAAGRVREIQHRVVAAAELHALILRRQEAAAPEAVVERLIGGAGRVARDHHDERRQVLVQLPRPYATHAPMLGRPASCEPV